MDNTKFAVYTSFYNCSEYIDQVFESVLNINYDNWNWFVTDDFSTDDTGILLREKCKNNSRIIYVDQTKKKEMYWQPNNFIPLDYEYIMLVCSDDLVDPEILNVYSKHIEKYNKELSILSVDFSKVEEVSQKIHSRGYVLNSENFIDKLKFYHPSIDYLSNLSYYAFGHAMCFRNTLDLKFEIDDFDASAEDSYRMMFMLSRGQWLHIPRNMYRWTYREDSESHSKVKSNFNGNFDVAYNKCANNIINPICYYNDCYKELNALISVEDLKKYNTISIFSPNINFEQREKIKNLYPDKNILFNSHNRSELYLIINNYYECKNSLDDILLQIKNNNNSFDLLIYNLDENFYLNRDDMVNSSSEIKEKIGESISSFFSGYHYFSYFRHLIFTLLK